MEEDSYKGIKIFKDLPYLGFVNPLNLEYNRTTTSRSFISKSRRKKFLEAVSKVLSIEEDKKKYLPLIRRILKLDNPQKFADYLDISCRSTFRLRKSLPDSHERILEIGLATVAYPDSRFLMVFDRENIRINKEKIYQDIGIDSREKIKLEEIFFTWSEKSQKWIIEDE